MAEHYSPLRYPGGKAKLSSFVTRVLTDNDFMRPQYVEPYAGGAGVALRLLFEEYVSRVVINDADPRIACFWKAVARYPERFMERIREIPLSVNEWHRQREIYMRRDLRRTFDLGFATFYLNRTTRSGIVHNGGPIGGYDQTGKYKIDARFNRDTLIQRVTRIGAYADRIEVSDRDGLALLRELNESGREPGDTFVYVDPPYYRKGRELYMNHFNHAEHEALAEFLCGECAFAWVLTYDDTDEIAALYESLRQRRFDLSYSAYKRRTGSELLILPERLQMTDDAIALLPYEAA